MKKLKVLRNSKDSMRLQYWLKFLRLGKSTWKTKIHQWRKQDIWKCFASKSKQSSAWNWWYTAGSTKYNFYSNYKCHYRILTYTFTAKQEILDKDISSLKDDKLDLLQTIANQANKINELESMIECK